jgi:UDP-3-O-[3-hydroxymyristoyl] N-acetylglucosamine deacetylase
MQATIQKPISCYGIGVHSGKKTQVTLKPAKPNTGIVFIRTDITSLDNRINATYDNVFDTTLSTSIRNNAKVHISTIEHLMAAIWGCSVNNMIVEIDGPEVPIMDGSSKAFVFMIECAGIKSQNAPKRNLKILKEISVCDNSSEIFARPAKSTHIDLTIDFTASVIGRQHYSFTAGTNFKEEIANSRTFGFMHELEYLQQKGLAKGASLDNAIGIDKNIVLNHEGLRHKNEFVRHKLLDILGDLFCTGGNFIGSLNGYKTSHYLNNQLLHKIFSDPFAYRWVNDSK